ncbi:MAG: hypothetical protein IJI38_00215 [Clostridia bacterium]|nr:hypothetical protein [Clostridia bacterium]
MVNWYDMQAMKMGNVMSEDVGAPELRNPRYTAMRQRRFGWIAKLFGLR